eukprot:GHUV01028663.1.p2 GENE.GHUV01028663.1~~GHUV01028663.1.p2  ORF type:complete len:114 (-),score=4.69 GHUV01028663.1:1371-1712(-)
MYHCMSIMIRCCNATISATQGDQSREIIRVLVECCLQEARYNPYYGHLAARLAAVSKSHKVTLQYCIWDQWKEVGSTEPRRLVCLAGLVGHCCASFVLPLSALKPVSEVDNLL